MQQGEFVYPDLYQDSVCDCACVYVCLKPANYIYKYTYINTTVICS